MAGKAALLNRGGILRLCSMTQQTLHVLDGPRAKLVRAAQQTRVLVAHCAAYEKSQPVRLEAIWGDDAHIVYVRPRLPPLYLGLILGEIVHDLRSALDHVAWALASEFAGDALDKPSVAGAITFPIRSTREKFEKHRAKPYFDPDAWAVMETVQPFTNDGLALVNPLAVIQDWSNGDKHRVLRPALGRLQVDDIKFQCTAPVDVNDVEMIPADSTLIDHMEGVFRIPAPADARFYFFPPPVFVAFVTFARGIPEPVNPDGVLKLVLQASEVVELFARFFPETDWTLRTDSWITPDSPAPAIDGYARDE